MIKFYMIRVSDFKNITYGQKIKEPYTYVFQHDALSLSYILNDGRMRVTTTHVASLILREC